MEKEAVREQGLYAEVARAQRAFDDGDLGEAQQLFSRTLEQCLSREFGYQDFCLRLARDYLLALRCLDARKTALQNTHHVRAAELACWATRLAKLSQEHRALVLKGMVVRAVFASLTRPVAINDASRLKNYSTTVALAQRLQARSSQIPQPRSTELANLAQTALRVSEQRGSRDAVPLAFDFERPFELCATSLTPIYTDESHATVRCTACATWHHAQFAGQPCPLCRTGTLDAKPTLTRRGLFLCRCGCSDACDHADGYDDEELRVTEDFARALGLCSIEPPSKEQNSKQL